MILNENKSSERYGLYENNIFYIFPSKFSQKLEQLGFNTDKVKQGFKERKYIVTDNDTSTTISMLYKGEKRDFIGFRLVTKSTINEEEIEELKNKNTKVTYINPRIPTLEEIDLFKENDI